MRELDRLDLKILDILQREGRIPVTELAERVNPPPLLRPHQAHGARGRDHRLPRARQSGGAGQNLLVFLEIKLSAKSGDVFDKVKQELLYVPEVMECHLVSGEFDYLVKARLSEMNEYRRLLGEILKRLPASAESHSYIVMEEIKESLYLPVDR